VRSRASRRSGDSQSGAYSTLDEWNQPRVASNASSRMSMTMPDVRLAFVTSMSNGSGFHGAGCSSNVWFAFDRALHCTSTFLSGRMRCSRVNVVASMLKAGWIPSRWCRCLCATARATRLTYPPAEERRHRGACGGAEIERSVATPAVTARPNRLRAAKSVVAPRLNARPPSSNVGRMSLGSSLLDCAVSFSSMSHLKRNRGHS
jgi:hypothetical protein